MQKRRFVILAAICVALASLTLAGAQTTTTIGNLPLNSAPLNSYFTVVDDGSTRTWKSTIQAIVNAALAANPATVAQGGTGTTSPAPTATSTGCASLAYSGTWPNQTLTGTFTGCQPSLTLPLSVVNGGSGTSAPSPTVTATACAASPSLLGSWPNQTLSVPAGCSPAPASTSAGYSGGNYAVLLAALKADAGVQHVWWGNDNPSGCASSCTPGPCPSNIHDAINDGGYSTAAPSEQDLTTIGVSPTPSPLCGSAPTLLGGPTTAQFCSRSNGNPGQCGSSSNTAHFSIPSAAFPIPSPLSSPPAFSIACVFTWAGTTTSAGQYLFQIPDANTSLSIRLDNGNGQTTLNVNGSNDQLTWPNAAIGRHLIIYSWDGAGNNALFLDRFPLVQKWPVALATASVATPGPSDLGAGSGGNNGSDMAFGPCWERRPNYTWNDAISLFNDTGL